MNKLQFFAVVLVAPAASAVLVDDYPPERVTTIETRHGRVVAEEELEDGSHVATGAIIGGLIGLGSSGGKSGSTKVKRTAGGAILGGVIGSQVDKSKNSLYTIQLVGGGEVQAVLSKKALKVGDCAAINYRSDRTDVHYASDYYCAPHSQVAPAQPFPDESDPCLEAKRRLLEATDPAEIEVLERKVSIICDG